mgnify:FL=1
MFGAQWGFTFTCNSIQTTSPRKTGTRRDGCFVWLLAACASTSAVVTNARYLTSWSYVHGHHFFIWHSPGSVEQPSTRSEAGTVPHPHSVPGTNSWQLEEPTQADDNDIIKPPVPARATKPIQPAAKPRRERTAPVVVQVGAPLPQVERPESGTVIPTDEETPPCRIPSSSGSVSTTSSAPCSPTNESAQDERGTSPCSVEHTEHTVGAVAFVGQKCTSSPPPSPVPSAQIRLDGSPDGTSHVALTVPPSHPVVLA